MEHITVGIGPGDRESALQKDVAGVDPLVDEMHGDADLCSPLMIAQLMTLRPRIPRQLARVNIEEP